MHDSGIRQLTWTTNVEEKDRQSSEDNPNNSTRDIAQQLGVYQSAVWKIMQENEMSIHYVLSTCESIYTERVT
ncbi:hypothetical protein TNIN_76621 [Trichonephila inaurata madagascariensis]|uniref:Uncharacterized protein n=1 Tax=Trichonephila inaurata madagascariensis TaxID=2747483 RepID=A0A8X7BTL0_9ARAC|nr:hypothetical protein TNIN_76621 [Trichonephila inaurata madagascariensis]